MWYHCYHIDDGVEEGMWQNKVSVSTMKYFNPSLTRWKCKMMKMRLRKVGGPRLVRELEVDSRFPECQACVLLFNRHLPSIHYVPELLLSGAQGGYNSEQPWKFLSSLYCFLDQTDCLLITLLLRSLVCCFCFFKSLPLIFLIENSRKYPILSASSLLSHMPTDSDTSFSKIHTKSDCSETHPVIRYIFNIHKAFKGVDVFII